MVMAMEIIISVILLFVGIAVLIIIHVCVVGRAFRGEPINGRSSVLTRVDRTPGMNPENVKKLPCFDYKVEEKGKRNGNVDCAVCLENFMAGEKCRVLPQCNHSFHAECIDSWLLKIAACPICRTDVRSSQFEENARSICSGEVGVELL